PQSLQRRGPGLFSGPRLTGHLCALVPGGPPQREAACAFPSRGQPGPEPGPAVISAPAQYARILGVPHGVHGLESHCGDLPGTVQPVPDRGRGEPAWLGAIGVATREDLDHLTFVSNCNSQQLDGPVRGNRKILQELESFFRGAGWNVINVVWGRGWDELLARDVDGVLV